MSSMRPHERLLEWLKLENKKLMLQRFASVFSADAEFADELGAGCLRDRVYSYEEVRPIVAQGNDEGGAVVFAALDSVTGLPVRMAWVFAARNGLVTKVTKTSSVRLPHDDVEVAQTQLEAEQLIGEFRLRRITESNRAGYEAAVRIVLASIQESHPGVRLEELGCFFEPPAFEAKSWWFVPFGWIGCQGHIVEKASARVHQLGSGPSFPLSLCFWAQERGALKSPCILAIDKIHDSARAGELLQELDNQSPYNPVPLQGRASDGSMRWLKPEVLLAQVPVRIEVASLWFALPTLKEAELTHAFDFHIEDASSS